MEPSILITRPEEFAELLIAASVVSARGFAFCMHERACHDGDEHRATFWNDVRMLCPVVARSQAGW